MLRKGNVIITLRLYNLRYLNVINYVIFKAEKLHKKVFAF